MSTITIEEAQAKLPELIEKLGPGEEIVITRDAQPVAKLLSQRVPSPNGTRRVPGRGKGMITIISDDDEHLKDFSDYMP